jgi:hypothetical protein
MSLLYVSVAILLSVGWGANIVTAEITLNDV